MPVGCILQKTPGCCCSASISQMVPLRFTQWQQLQSYAEHCIIIQKSHGDKQGGRGPHPPTVTPLQCYSCNGRHRWLMHNSSLVRRHQTTGMSISDRQLEEKHVLWWPSVHRERERERHCTYRTQTEQLDHIMCRHHHRRIAHILLGYKTNSERGILSRLLRLGNSSFLHL